MKSYCMTFKGHLSFIKLIFFGIFLKRNLGNLSSFNFGHFWKRKCQKGTVNYYRGTYMTSRSVGTNKTVYNRDMSVQNNETFDFKKPFSLAN